MRFSNSGFLHGSASDYIGAVLNFFENPRRYSQLKVYWCRTGLIFSFKFPLSCQPSDIVPIVYTGVVDTGGAP